jgi:hypothetical protein
MKTPITDAVYPPDIIDREFKAQGRTYGWGTLHDMRDVARRLERQRDELLEALEFYRKHMLLGYEITDRGQVAEAAIAAVKGGQP